MGLFGPFSSPKMIKLALTTAGVEKARLDHDRDRDELVLSVLVAGEIKHVRIPIGITYTIDELAAWLAGEDPFSAELDTIDQAGQKVGTQLSGPAGDRPETPPNL